MSFTLSKQSQRSGSVLLDESIFLGLFWKEKKRLITEEIQNQNYKICKLLLLNSALKQVFFPFKTILKMDLDFQNCFERDPPS